ncbi:uncharacterized protein B0I36DRAFT_436317 [Microdochium trichocladiopsis]|uniref:NAD(P)-binding protein n=1 Tax=Microdochium trichocladiopsis TaxID=1682393 RepID=A0A9P8XRU6_9PEZI|nr:uncharacterized protein B0I36DRAFT_436317 [Microdochium trichocladiopsis]KAH7014259.1 hypothetical protein B0I36DRAFT_436317 [Microdochium trichocladiopsis]
MEQILMRFSPVALPPADTFHDQTCLVTGGTGGLGLALAAHFINLGAKQVVITSRNAAKSKNALKELEKLTSGKSAPKDKVRVMELDMSSFKSVVNFAAEASKINSGKGGLDCVFLNAGAIAVDYELTDDGFETNLQTNAIGTALLARLLLDSMLRERPNRTTLAHMGLTGSGHHLTFTVEELDKWAATPPMGDGGSVRGGLVGYVNDPKKYPNPDFSYSITKTLAHYAMAQIAELARDEKTGRPQVIVNTCCPGIVKTDLARNHAAKGLHMVAGIALFHGVLGKTAEQGARTLLRSVMTGEEQHGEFIRFYGDKAKTAEQSSKLFKSETGKKVRAAFWREVGDVVREKAPSAAHLFPRAEKA